MKKRLVCALMVLSLTIAMAAGCSMDSSVDTSGEEETPENLSDITIGACVMSLQHEFMANLVVGYEEFQKQTGVNMNITDGGNMEPDKQVTNVENYISQKVDGILCQCISVETMKDTLQSAMDRGIPVGIYPYDESVGATTYFGYNEYEWGEKLGETAAEWIQDKLDGTAKILSVTTSLEESAVQRNKGWTDKINEVCGEENITWNTVEATSASDAIDAVESALQANPDTDIVLVYNDELGIGAYEAINQSGLDTSNMFLGSCDGTDTVLDYVEQDTVYRCTVGNDRFVSEIGFYWAQNMLKIILGMDYEDPFPIETTAITVDNVSEYRSREANYELDQDIAAMVDAE